MQIEVYFRDQEWQDFAPVGKRQDWPLAEEMTFLNHGSFGSCPREVLAYQRELRDRLERQPVQFFVRDLEGLWDEARFRLAQFLGASPDGFTFVSNATQGVNTVLRSLSWKPGDALLVTDHEYNACRNALNFIADRTGAVVQVVHLTLPIKQASDVVDQIVEQVTPQTRLLLIDHVTSPTAIVMPLDAIIAAMRQRGVATLVDGAHAPGMIPLDLDALGAEYYTGNCHKWLCAPKGAAFLHVRQDCVDQIRPLSISHGANATRQDRSPFHLEFSWTGTSDPTACLSVPKSIEWMEGQLPGGWSAIMQRNQALARAARRFLQDQLHWQPVVPPEMLGSMAVLQMPDASSAAIPTSPLYADPLQDFLWGEHHVEVPIIPWPAPPKRLVRISAQLYNCPKDYLNLFYALTSALNR